MNKFVYFSSIAITALLSACGGGGTDSPQQVVVQQGSVQQAEVSPLAAKVVPTLLQGTYAGYETAGYAITSLSQATGAFKDLAEKTCSGAVSYAQNKKSGLVETYCVNGATYRLNTATLEVLPGAAIPKGKPFLPSLACADDGTCFFGRGNYNYPNLPSSAAMYVVGASGALEDTIQFPDFANNRLPVKMGVVRHAGVEKLVAVSQGYDHDDIGVHVFDVSARKWESLCSLKAAQVSVNIGADVVLTLRRGLSATESDAIVVDVHTCAIKATLRIPVEEKGIPIARFAVQADDAIYLGGGSERTEGAGPFGVWKFDATTHQNTGYLQTASYVFAGTYAKSTRKLWVATSGNMILEVDPVTMTKAREFAKPLFGGDMFYAE